MPDPISSSSSSPVADSSYDPYLDEAGKVSRADAPNSSQAAPSPVASPSIPILVKAVPPPSLLPPTAAGGAALSTANNNAQRTSERVGVHPYLAEGPTAAGDSQFAAAAALKGRDPKTGLEVEVASVSAQAGQQDEIQATFVRVGRTAGVLNWNAEAFTARLHAGIHNDDGSTGANFGVGVSAVGLDTTIGDTNSLTYGVSGGGGVDGSVGLRDKDKDGRVELCARVAAGPMTVGFCLESPL